MSCWPKLVPTASSTLANSPNNLFHGVTQVSLTCLHSSTYNRTMLLRVDLASSQPLHDQLAGQLRKAIAAGDPAPGDKLPPARDLAESLGVNVHTLLRAFKTLRDEGLLEVRRGRGTIVTDVAPQRVNFVHLAKTLVEEARRAGLADDKIRQLVEAQL